MSGNRGGEPVCPCGGRELEEVFAYVEPPEGEIRFPFCAGQYRRVVSRCPVCGHFVSRHAMDMSCLYEGQYVDATYGAGLRQTFERIVGLPVGRSDNEGRARRVLAFARDWFAGRGEGFRPSILDVGSGLCVFLHRMRREGWDCLALDPDARAVEHARQAAGVAALCGDFLTVDPPGTFHVLTLNKVLEHVLDPVAMLARSRDFVRPDGFVYVELPDGEQAVHEGPGREEFFIDHHHVFSLASLALLATRAGFVALALERLREPSGKFTLRGFLTPA